MGNPVDVRAEVVASPAIGPEGTIFVADRGGATWTIRIAAPDDRSAEDPYPVTVLLSPKQPLPTGYEVHVVDRASSSTVPLVDHQYTTTLTPDRPTREFDVLIGTHEFLGQQLTDVETTIPDVLQNYPNPFNPSTAIRFSVREKSHVEVRIFDILGRSVRRLTAEDRERGLHEVVWDGRDDAGRPLASGAYVCRISSGSDARSHLITLLR